MLFRSKDMEAIRRIWEGRGVSFSAEVKAELSELCGTARHCQIAELTAIITLCGRIQITEDDDYRLWIHTENISVAKKFFLLLKHSGEVFASGNILPFTPSKPEN